jgi:Matrixin
MMCQGRLLIVLGIFVLLQGCAKQQNQGNGWSSFPVTIYADPAISQNQQAQADLQNALSFWEGKAGKQLFSYQGAWNASGTPYVGSPSQPTAISANVIFFQNPWPYAASIAGQTVVLSSNGQFEGAIIMINPNIPTCTGTCSGNNSEVGQVMVFAHELGHFIGLQHVQDPANLMNPTLSPGSSLESVTIDQATLDSLTQR